MIPAARETLASRRNGDGPCRVGTVVSSRRFDSTLEPQAPPRPCPMRRRKPARPVQHSRDPRRDEPPPATDAIHPHRSVDPVVAFGSRSAFRSHNPRRIRPGSRPRVRATNQSGGLPESHSCLRAPDPGVRPSHFKNPTVARSRGPRTNPQESSTVRSSKPTPHQSANRHTAIR